MRSNPSKVASTQVLGEGMPGGRIRADM